ncbi:ATP-binding protein [Runella sp.]|uniref:hybrid sensor histidine kinase/response regulator transcription factor n=1 Tax=Runella sp. TaxID=1960881 RepID=UPI003D13C260
MPKPLQVISVEGHFFGGSDITKDRFGNYWFAGRKGMCRYDGKQTRIFRDPKADKEEFYTKARASVDGKVWFKTSRGYSLSYFDPKRQQIVRIPDSASVIKNYLTKYGSTFLYPDKKGIVWIGLQEIGLLRFDPATNDVKRITNRKINVNGITEDDFGHLWLATNQGVQQYDPVSGKFTIFLHDPLNDESLSDNHTHSVNLRKNGDLWIGFQNMVNILSPKTGKVKRIPLHSFPEYNTVINVVHDQTGNDYLAHGFIVYRYNDREGLLRMDLTPSGRYALAMMVDEKNRLWVGNAKFVRVYDLNQLQRTQSFHPLSITVNGSILKDNTENYSYTRDEKGVPVITLQENDNIVIYSAPAAPAKLYEYKQLLSGTEDAGLTFSTVNNRVTYTDMEAGNYTFITYNRLDSNRWEEAGSLKIIVITPLWKRWWAIALYVFLAGIIVFFVSKEWQKRRKLRKELRRREQETEVLQRVDEMKTHFFANLTHEFRTPLTLILNAAEQLEHSAPELTDRERIKSIQRNTHQLLRLINEMLDLTKKDAGKLEVIETIGDPIQQLSQLVRAFEGVAAKKQLTLAFKAPESGHDYLFDQDKIEKIVYNLLSNAIKFTPEAGKVTLEANITPEHILVIKVNDTGIGVAPEHLPHIFNRFYQADASFTKQYAGTGIGLALVKELVEMMGGTIKAESILNLGSSFRAQIPLKIATLKNASAGERSFEIHPSSLPSASDGHISVQHSTAAPLILVIEDNEELRSFLVDSLRLSYQVKAAGNGKEGIDLALEYIPDVVITDVMMPLVDGYDVIKTLKNDERTSHVPIIVLSAKSSFDSKLKGLEFGADEYMSKPFSLPELTVRVHNMLSIRQKLALKITGAESEESPKTNSLPQVLIEKERIFLQKIKNIVLENLSDETFEIETLAEKANMSRSQLYRKIQALTNQTTSQFIHKIRLERAHELLKQGNLNVTQVAYEVGYSSQSYFSKMYQEHFGYSPKKAKV